MIVLAVVVVLAAIVAVIVAVSSNGGSNAQGRSPAPSTSARTSPSTSGTSASPVTGEFRNYAAFTSLIGSAPDDTAHAFKGASCTLGSPPASISGVLDQIECNDLTGTPVEIGILRFSAKADADKFIGTLKIAFKTESWKIADQARGLLLTSPVGFKPPTLVTTICAMPTYVIGFSEPDATGTTAVNTQLRTIWGAANFPDSTPAACA